LRYLVKPKKAIISDSLSAFAPSLGLEPRRVMLMLSRPYVILFFYVTELYAFFIDFI
jgi:hypothetical protein